jgi:hypothetical protein
LDVIVIGTCRVHNPIETIAGNSKIKSLNIPQQSFVHTTPEIIQRIKHLKNKYKYNDSLKKYQIKNNSIDLISNFSFSDADIFLIEISSRKLILSNGDYLQWNNSINVVKKIGTEFSSLWLKSLSNKFKDGGGKIINFDVSNHLDFLSSKELRIISSIEAKKQKIIELERDMEEINNLTNGKVIFVSHINVLNKNLVSIKPREELINALKDICRKKNYNLIDPSVLLDSLGQSELMDKGGSSVNHYNPEKLYDLGMFFQENIVRLYSNSKILDEDI